MRIQSYGKFTFSFQTSGPIFFLSVITYTKQINDNQYFNKKLRFYQNYIKSRSVYTFKKVTCIIMRNITLSILMVTYTIFIA